MAKDVFISYSSKEIVTAIMIRDKLEKDGISCWMAPDSIAPGLDYMREIPRAIDECKVFLLLLSENAQKSPWVKKELATAVSKEKDVIPFLISPCEISEEFGFALSNAQRWDAYDSMKSSLGRLVTRIHASAESVSGNTPENIITTKLSNITENIDTDDTDNNNQELSAVNSNKGKNSVKVLLFATVFVVMVGITSVFLISSLKNKPPKQDKVTSVGAEMNKEEIPNATSTPSPEPKPTSTSEANPTPTATPESTPGPTPEAEITPTLTETPTLSEETYTFAYITLADQTVIITGILSGNASKMVIPEEIDGKIVVEIGPNAFENCTTFKYVEIPHTITKINEQAFIGCSSLVEIYIPGNVKNIERNAFWGCTSLTNISLEEGIKSINDFAFNECLSIKSFHLPASITQLGVSILSHTCEKFTINGNNLYYSIEDNIVYNKQKDILVYVPTFVNQNNFEVLLGIERLEDYSFYGCGNILSVSLSNSVTSIGRFAFAATEIRAVIMTENVSFIDDAAFFGRTHDIKIYAPYNSYAWNYAISKGIDVAELNVK